MSAEEENKPEQKERRSYFRVDDVISVVANPVHIDKEKLEKFLKTVSSSKAFSLLDVSTSDEIETAGISADLSDNKRLFDMITEVKTKLDFVINHLLLEKEGLLSVEKKLVNISASGISFTINQPVNVNDIMEIKLLLPTYPPVAVFAYGEVKRVKVLDNETYDVALEYLNMGDSVRNEIIQYTLSHQRETIRKREETGTDE
jgi:c-di-GMP-binding flagellar brake protein YcgR